MFSHFFPPWQFFMGWLCSLAVIIISHVLVHFSFAEFLKLGLSITGLIFCNICSLLLTGASLVAHTVKSLPAVWETGVHSLGWEVSPGEGNGNPLLYSCLENPTDRGAWQTAVHGVAKSHTQLND